MSYDLMVFEVSAAPSERPAFLEWYQAQTEWRETHDYNDSSITSANLQKWYAAISSIYPNMNGSGISDEDLDNPRLTDYSIGKEVIYAAFAWSEAEKAYPLVRQLAFDHKVGFYDVSADEGDGEIFYPGQSLREPSGGTWRKISNKFQAEENPVPTKRSFFDFFRRKK